MKNPNGYGSVVKLSGNRRRPWMVRITTARVIEDGKARQVRKVIGYYANRKDALSALALYNTDPYDPDVKQITFEDVYKRWSPEHPLAEKSMKQREYAFRCCKPLHDLPMQQIRVQQIEDVYSSVKPSIAQQVRVVIRGVFQYAMRHEFVVKNYAELAQAPKLPPTKIVRQAFDSAQIDAIRKDDTDISDMVFVAILTGFRPQELTLLNAEDVDLEEKTIRGGMKTESGKNRIVPIHPAIEPIISALADRGGRLFRDEVGEPLNYDRYRNRFMAMMELHGWKHTCHDTRHTFVTLAKESGMNEYILKMIVGHNVADITERVYTHRSIEQMREEMQKIVLPT